MMQSKIAFKVEEIRQKLKRDQSMDNVDDNKAEEQKVRLFVSMCPIAVIEYIFVYGIGRGATG